MRLPAVSVLMPVHNGALFLPEALDSVWSQGFTDLELVVVDDASDDDTASILDAVEDPRLRRVCLERRTGVSGALNAGLNVCRAPLVARLDADDRCLADRIERQVDAMARRPSLAALGTSAILVDRGGHPRGRRDVPTGSVAVLRRLRWRNALITSSVMFRRDVVSALDGYSPGLGQSEDYELWLRLAAVGELDNLGEPLVAYRLHPAQLTYAKISAPAPMQAVGDARKALAKSRGESVALASWRQQVWVAAQRRGDRRRH
jgi:glycosyltransferase involved in cell wall biosynthesis